jgi:hypothetical protein
LNNNSDFLETDNIDTTGNNVAIANPNTQNVEIEDTKPAAKSMDACE